MTIPSTANGWSLIGLPSSWYWTQMDWIISSPNAANVSPFSQQAQVFSWMGADGWKVTVTLPPLNDDQAREWESFLWDAQGGATAFLIGNPLRKTPKGNPKPASAAGILVNGTNAAMVSTINLRGFTASEPRVFVKGDLISVNYRLYMVRDQYVSADASGNATVIIGPSLREALTDGMAVATHNATGMFRLAKGDSPFSIDSNRQTSMSLQLVEAR
jgi:hypothetical protein